MQGDSPATTVGWPWGVDRLQRSDEEMALREETCLTEARSLQLLTNSSLRVLSKCTYDPSPTPAAGGQEAASGASRDQVRKGGMWRKEWNLHLPGMSGNFLPHQLCSDFLRHPPETQLGPSTQFDLPSRETFPRDSLGPASVGSGFLTSGSAGAFHAQDLFLTCH